MIQNYIKEMRKERGITSETLAREVGVTRVAINNIETMKNWASSDVLEKIAAVFGVEVYELFRPSEPSKYFACPHCGKPIKISVK